MAMAEKSFCLKDCIQVCVSSFSSRRGNVATITGGEKRLLPLKMHMRKKEKKRQLSWWLSGKESACQCWRHRFDPQSGMIQHTSEPLRPWARNYWACTQEPRSSNHWPHGPQLLKPEHFRASTLQNEKPLQWEGRAPQLDRSLAWCN